jgi:DNA-binding NarL/FixJ family response regulator
VAERSLRAIAGPPSGGAPKPLLAAHRPVPAPVHQRETGTLPGTRGAGDDHVARAEHLYEESIELVLDGVARPRTDEGLSDDEQGHDPIGPDGQEGTGHYDTERHARQLSHDPIVASPAAPGYREPTPPTTEIMPEGPTEEPGTVVPRARAGGDEVRLVIVDDHALVREGTSRLLDQEPGLCVVGTAGSAEEAVDLLGRLQPDVALVDVSLPGQSGLELARWASASAPAVRVVILSAYDDIAFVDEALNTGVAGYLLKTASGHELAEAVRAAADGVFVLDRAISRRLARRPGSERPRPAIALTPREAEVLTLVARGLPNKRIAAELGLGVRTIEGYVSGVLGKLGAASRTEAALYALSHPGPGNDG